jgi:hypothetical protein
MLRKMLFPISNPTLNMENLRFGWISFIHVVLQVNEQALNFYNIHVSVQCRLLKLRGLSLTAGTLHTTGSETICPHPVVSLSLGL